MGISKTYHIEEKERKESEWRQMFTDGAEIEIGKEYAGIRQRSGVINGPFTALAYENGILLVGDPERNRYAVIHGDVAEYGGQIITEAVRGGVFKINADLAELPDGEEGVQLLQRASQVKFFFALTEDEARLFLKWNREEEFEGYYM